MAIGKIKASRVNRVDANTYVGEDGILFYNYGNGVIRISDGITPGGVPIPYTIASNTTIGGIKAGPGVVISNEGVLVIDSANLSFSFGNFTANNNILTVVNSNEDMILQTQGNAEIQLIGNIGFYKPDGIPPTLANRYFYANSDGQIAIYVSSEDAQNAAVKIVGSTTGNIIAPGLPGSMLHITGQLGTPSRVYYDGNSDYVSWVARRWNGNVNAPTQVLANEDILRINATGATNVGVGNVAMAQITFTSIENQTTTAQGSKLAFIVTPAGTPATSRIEVANITTANGVNATKITTSGNVTATGNVNAGNLNLSGNIIADYIIANNVGNLGNVEIESNNTYWYFTTDNRFVGNGNISVGNISTTGTYTGYYTHTLRNAGVIADAGTLTIDFTTDDIVKCIWGNGMTVAYTNFIPGRSVRLIATKTTGTGTDTLSLGTISANQTSTGSTSISAAADVTYIIEFYSTNSTIAGLFAKI